MDNDSIVILEKPDSVSWDDIHDCIWNAHAENRKNGIYMKFPSLSGDQIRNKVGDVGRFFVALSNGKVVGTAAVIKKKETLWCGKPNEEYAYFCFASVLPDYSGLGIYRKLCELCDSVAKEFGCSKILYDTHEDNLRQQIISKKNGYHKVSYKYCKDHYNVVYVKWYGGCPYCELWIFLMYMYDRFKIRFYYKIKAFMSSSHMI